ncbi:MAG: GIY-YIG nuclease family protein [Brevundimonas sp.]|uniref:GIY-YIG nuclease family protein n=1 Tax=Brevundimonas sp. TaxID=1871086 RepID=UPI00261EE8F7|nr:GIY-YIG nuclease family protein [Brevundimonas sp.]MDI6623102.1 GIY-YIG nuclease family protein [Brevundimonas sp.]MDQ7812135.1 GIY-YIG nuclease family protein [Brevundimonas sp.]
MPDLSDLELLTDLGVEIETKKAAARTPREERIIAGFEDIVKFVDEHGRPPRHGEDRDIFERIYAVRLDRIRAQPDCRALVEPLDSHGLLAGSDGVAEAPAEFEDDAALLADLGVAPGGESDIAVLKHVRSRDEVKAAEEVANRKVCADFSTFKPLFAAVTHDLESGAREARRFGEDAGIKPGEFFILGGQTVYVAEVLETFVSEYGRPDSRLRVVYDNGTESDLLLRSLQRGLYKDETGRRITDPIAGPLFGHESEDDDLRSGTIYVLRSKSDHPEVAAHRELIHKIGVTGGSVETRIAQAVTDATYLLAEVEIVATYKLFNINRAKLENMLHRVFAPARLDLVIEDRFGSPVRPKEWFLVPLHVIDEVVEKIRDQSISRFVYDPESASLTGV